MVKKPHYSRDKKVKYIALVWTCTEELLKKSIIYEFGNKIDS
jgi:hypothetical protein